MLQSGVDRSKSGVVPGFVLSEAASFSSGVGIGSPFLLPVLPDDRKCLMSYYCKYIMSYDYKSIMLFRVSRADGRMGVGRFLAAGLEAHRTR